MEPLLFLGAAPQGRRPSDAMGGFLNPTHPGGRIRAQLGAQQPLAGGRGRESSGRFVGTRESLSGTPGAPAKAPAPGRGFRPLREGSLPPH